MADEETEKTSRKSSTKEIKEISKKSLNVMEEVFNKKPESTISVSKEEGGWRVVIEVLERKSVPDTQDILGRYELKLDTDGELLDYKQIALRRRCDLIAQEELE